MTPGRSSSGLPPPLTSPAEGEIPGPVSSSLCSAMLCREAGGGWWVDEQRGKVRCRRSSCLWIHWMRLGGVSAREIRSGCSVFQGGFGVSRLGRIERCWTC
ncbi:hypothetical protein VPH35_028674 [Triticum aestivum]